MVPLSGSSRKAIAVDANLLLLLLIGTWSPAFIAKHKRLSAFNAGDFFLVRDFVQSFQFIATTAHVLTEVSNLAGLTTGGARAPIFGQLAEMIVLFDERTFTSRTASACSEFALFGLTDAALSIVCKDTPLLTEDRKLADYLQRKGLTAWTLDNLRWSREQANHAV